MVHSTDVGAPLAAQDTAATAPAQGTAFRLRTLVDMTSYNYDTTAPALKLQVATRSGTCDTGFSGETYADVATGSGAIRYYNNATPADGAIATSNASDPTYAGHTKIMQGYEEANNASIVANIPASQFGEFDFSLVDNSAPGGTTYCFRLVDSAGSTLDTYTSIPQITTNVANQAPNAPANLAQTKTNNDPIPKTTLLSYDSAIGQSFDPTAGNTISIDTGTKRTGAGSLKDVTTGQGIWVSDGNATPRDLSANGSTFSAWIYYPSSNSSTAADGRINIFAADGSTVTSGPITNLVPDVWNLVTFTVPPDLLANMTYTNVSVFGNIAGSNTYYIDDFQQGNGIWTPETSVKFTASVSDADNPDTDQLCIEMKPVGSAFTNTEDSCGTGVAYSGTPVAATHTLSSLSNGTQYHWQARVKDAGGLYSSWVAYGGNKDTVTASPDVGIDTSAPTSGSVQDGSTQGVDVGYNSGALDSLGGNWTGFSDGSSGIARYEYSIGTSPGGTQTLSWTSTSLTEVTATGLTLHTGQTYYFNVRAVDVVGNTSSTVSSNGQSVAPTLTFSASTSAISFANLNSANSYTDTQSVILTTSTNAYGGYVVHSKTTGLFASGGNTIGMFNGGTYASPDAWQGADQGFGYTSSDTSVQGSNKFQAATCPGGSAISGAGCYAPFTTTGLGDIIADHASGVTTPITGESFTVTLKVASNSIQPAGRYSTTVVFDNTVSF